MENGDDPRCPVCGQSLDIVVDEETRTSTVGPCTNPECPSNTIEFETETQD